MRFDFNKKVTMREQFKVMLVILLISCLLFTFVYFIRSCSVSESVHSDVSSQPYEPSHNESYEQSFESALNSKSEPSHESSSEPLNSYGKLENIIYISKNYDEIYNGELILVNKDYECHHNGEDTVEIFSNKSNTYAVTDTSVYVNGDIIDNMNEMFDDFAEIYGYSDVMVACAYRSYELQVQLYNEEIQNKGETEAEQWVAPPGFSEHQTGYVFDLNLNIENGVLGIKYDGTGIYRWINENCHKYGFILRYLKGKEKITGYEYEPWHFRYIGFPHASYIMDKKITLEEYIDIVHMHSVDNPLIIENENGECWYVYYVKAYNGETSVPVSDDYPYQISGDNFSGFIVTQKVK